MIPRIIESDIRQELNRIGVDPAGIKIMVPKGEFLAIKIEALRPTAANILKQEILAIGGEAATAYGSINHSVKTTPVIILATIRQLTDLMKKLAQHQFGLPQLAKQLRASISNYRNIPTPLKFRRRTLSFGRRTYIMGILNITPDSFSDGGRYFSLDSAVKHAEQLLSEGADIIDIGGESTRPGAARVSAQQEIERIVPVIAALRRQRRAIISVDTRKAPVAQAALAAGADMINDVSGLKYDHKMAAVIAKAGCPVCLMHMRGTPATMQKNTAYSDLLGELINELQGSLAIAENAGILQGKIIVDPGIGFGKTAEQSLVIVRRLAELKALGRPILIGPSRKSVVGQTLGLPPEERLEGTLALIALAIANGADIVRVHDVKQVKRAAQMADATVRRRKNG
ncbi:dihydropteroate synthase [candidate division WOR-1 bacterium RIFOXYB2_FULL_48_7]|uniref:Dihydropteroate synthase n=1 Tax=candidate division WOR-1 bacterium RIFOXYB2_FULL_48_7 TaxID=1802583 RepID=A0A1F4TCV3_UNCSA|nr:MAG: dihydropteroate synthase [candidate division WOR-1 bacterium RIFOXYB2_FULL_48_7]